VSTYELDESDVMIILQRLRDGTGNMAREVADRLEAQFPIPVPVKIGAVVRCAEPNYLYTRCRLDSDSDTPWIDAEDGELRSTERLGRITEVLSPGVDL
jgi:hypothetical protein